MFYWITKLITFLIFLQQIMQEVINNQMEMYSQSILQETEQDRYCIASASFECGRSQSDRFTSMKTIRYSINRWKRVIVYFIWVKLCDRTFKCINHNWTTFCVFVLFCFLKLIHCAGIKWQIHRKLQISGVETVD